MGVFDLDRIKEGDIVLDFKNPQSTEIMPNSVSRKYCYNDYYEGLAPSKHSAKDPIKMPRKFEASNMVGVKYENGGVAHINVYMNPGDGLERPPDLIMGPEDINKLDAIYKAIHGTNDAMVYGEYPVQGVYLNRGDIETLLNFAEEAFEDDVNIVTLHNSSATEKPEKYKFIILSPCEEGMVQVYRADNMEEPLISEISIDTLKNLPKIIMKKRMQEYIMVPEIDSTQPDGDVIEGMFNRRIDLKWNHTNPVPYDMHGLSVVGGGRYMLTYKPETVDTEGARIQFDAATQELAKYESELGELGISIDGSSGGIRTGGAVLNPDDIEGILKDLEQLSHTDEYFATYFGDVGERDLEMPSADVNIPESLWSSPKREGYKVFEAIRDQTTGIVGIDVGPHSRE